MPDNRHPANPQKENPMRCDYCGLALAVDDPAPFHEICASEVSDAPLTSCPDGGCEACEPSDSVYDATREDGKKDN